MGEIEQLTFKQASEELEGILRALESNQLELEQSLEVYERGIALLRSLQSRLDGAQQKVVSLVGELEVGTDEEADSQLS